MELVVEVLSEDAADIGLTEARIQTIAEARLRSARLYADFMPLLPYLYIRVSVVGRAFSYEVTFVKSLYDPATDTQGLADTWEVGVTGTHGGDAGYVLQALSESLDTFLVEYLRVNEAAC